MSEIRPNTENKPDLTNDMSTTGLNIEVMTAWAKNLLNVNNGKLDRFEQVQPYFDYFKEEDGRGYPGLYEAVMKISNPKAVVAYDSLVEEFNSDLDRINNERDGKAVRDFYKRAQALKHQLPKDPQKPTGNIV